ncbi:molybdopterin-dependent oxidoreductase [Ralstonia insidiosa]|uniref:Oxidase n=1 Tax=Ralstonia insidiosa TaxID=190721 RepID=A0A191ZYP6_9RALS|nr:molybdopterin-dependent oxidoreductase [Ralstonia insidiosa]ANJ73208.1 oxidase [Ralstonia insidiosa]KAB0473578.1 molybdopterin-dependent oxidoreductase [Ralstonia insidiosa]MBY4911336.1 molybdopterin-dependent oxidoreductase [Ralstonia insidiosa]
MHPDDPQQRARRRGVLKALGTLGAGTALSHPALTALAATAGSVTLPFDNGERELVAFPQKRPLILLTSRPPQLETPFAVFNDGTITPNDAFFVRYHWAGIPTSIDPATYRLQVGGNVNTPLDLSLADLKALGEAREIVAVNQCSGNGRGYFQPRVGGGQLSNGAMGNARWTGVPLKQVLEKAGVRAGSVQVVFDGLDHPPLADAKSPDFIKALEIDHALDGEVMIAWAMNGADLPLLNGYPIRLIVPGHYGTYWVKHLTNIQVVDKPFDGFWMRTAYRIPDNTCACVAPGTTPAKTVPIGRFNVRSFITSLADGATVAAGREHIVRGIAFDGGYGITEVAFSADGGRTWVEAQLGEDLGKYSFREWRAPFKPTRRGAYELKVRAVNRIGQSQPMTALWNPPGYMRNVVETTRVTAA